MNKELKRAIVVDSCNPENLVFAVINQAINDFTLMQNNRCLRRDKILPWPTVSKSGKTLTKKAASMSSPENVHLLHFFEKDSGMDALLAMTDSAAMGDRIRDRLFSGKYECSVDVEKKGRMFIGIIVPSGSRTSRKEAEPEKTRDGALSSARVLAREVGYQIVPKHILDGERK